MYGIASQSDVTLLLNALLCLTMDDPIHPIQLAGLRLQHPDWDYTQLDFEARQALRHAGT